MSQANADNQNAIEEKVLAQKVLELSKNQSLWHDFVKWLQDKSVRWSDDEPNVIRALVLNFLFEDDPTFQKNVLIELLNKRTEWNTESLNKLLTKQTNLPLFALCVERFNEINKQNDLCATFHATPDQLDTELMQKLLAEFPEFTFPGIYYTQTQVLGSGKVP